MTQIVDFVVCPTCGGDQYRLNGARTYKGDTCHCDVRTPEQIAADESVLKAFEAAEFLSDPEKEKKAVARARARAEARKVEGEE